MGRVIGDEQLDRTTNTSATPEQLLEVLTHPDRIQDWAPVDFDVDDWRRLSAGTRTRVTGRLAGVAVEFDVEVHAADEAGLQLSADGPIGLDVHYQLAQASSGSALNASVSLRVAAVASPAASSRTRRRRCSPPGPSRAPRAASPAPPRRRPSPPERSGASAAPSRPRTRRDGSGRG